jgi:YD repeat-containing protein
MLGEHWRGSYDSSINLPNFLHANARRADGAVLSFTLSAGIWSADADVVDKLEEIKDGSGNRTGWRYTLPDDAVEEYDVTGKLISITNREGFTQTLSYDVSTAEGGDGNANTLDKVTDNFGRTLTFTYNTNGRIATMIDPAGNVYRYTYDAAGNLASVVYPDETPANNTDNPMRIYHYENANFPYALTGITDENGNRFATWGYDSQGRANHGEHAGGAGQVDIVYNPDGTSTVTDSLGNIQTYHYEIQYGTVKPGQIDGDRCSNCNVQYRDITYDTNGFIASTTDFNGNVTHYVHDARGLETSRTEAVGTPEERTITTTWHATFRLPLTITEPGKVTTFTYDSQGRLLERKEEAAP